MNLDYRLLRDETTGQPIADNLATFQFANRYLGRTLADTPSVWVALRDHRQPYEIAAGQFEDTWYPQWGTTTSGSTRMTAFLAVVPSPRPTMSTSPCRSTTRCCLPQGSVVTRRTDQASGNPSMDFRVDPGYINGGSNAVTVTVTYLDLGADTWALTYDSTHGAATATPQGSANPWVQRITLDMEEGRLRHY